eukprot:8349313-Alexandrium_andersonii.AAC.1
MARNPLLRSSRSIGSCSARISNMDAQHASFSDWRKTFGTDERSVQPGCLWVNSSIPLDTVVVA